MLVSLVFDPSLSPLVSASLRAPLLQQRGPPPHLCWFLRRPRQSAAVPGLPGWPTPPAAPHLPHGNCWPEITSKEYEFTGQTEECKSGDLHRLRSEYEYISYKRTMKLPSVWCSVSSAVRKPRLFAALPSSWNRWDQPVRSGWCLNRHGEESQRREFRPRYSGVCLFSYTADRENRARASESQSFLVF